MRYSSIREKLFAQLFLIFGIYIGILPYILNDNYGLPLENMAIVILMSAVINYYFYKLNMRLEKIEKNFDTSSLIAKPIDEESVYRFFDDYVKKKYAYKVSIYVPFLTFSNSSLLSYVLKNLKIETEVRILLGKMENELLKKEFYYILNRTENKIIIKEQKSISSFFLVIIDKDVLVIETLSANENIHKQSPIIGIKMESFSKLGQQLIEDFNDRWVSANNIDENTNKKKISKKVEP